MEDNHSIVMVFRQILCISTYTWNLERWYRRLFVQGSKKRHRRKEQTFGLGGRRGWDDLREEHCHVRYHV